MAKLKKRSVAPIYAIAVVWVIFTLVHPLYRVSDYVSAILLSAVAFIVAKGIWPTVEYELPDPEPSEEAPKDEPGEEPTEEASEAEEPKKEDEPASTGDPKLDALIRDCTGGDRYLLYPDALRDLEKYKDDSSVLEQLDAMGNLRFVLGPELDPESAAALLAKLGLGDVGGKPVRDFSGGMKRRLALARALLAPSDALALDEPFTGLDEENRARCLALIRRAGAEKPVLLVTHDPDDARSLGAAVHKL